MECSSVASKSYLYFSLILRTAAEAEKEGKAFWWKMGLGNDGFSSSYFEAKCSKHLCIQGRLTKRKSTGLELN